MAGSLPAHAPSSEGYNSQTLRATHPPHRRTTRSVDTRRRTVVPSIPRTSYSTRHDHRPPPSRRVVAPQRSLSSDPFRSPTAADRTSVPASQERSQDDLPPPMQHNLYPFVDINLAKQGIPHREPLSRQLISYMLRVGKTSRRPTSRHMVPTPKAKSRSSLKRVLTDD